jgi:hypothetical protein
VSDKIERLHEVLKALQEAKDQVLFAIKKVDEIHRVVEELIQEKEGEEKTFLISCFCGREVLKRTNSLKSLTFSLSHSTICPCGGEHACLPNALKHVMISEKEEVEI